MEHTGACVDPPVDSDAGPCEISTTMNRPKDFSADVREALAHRAGFMCSFPGCTTPHTSGPSAEADTATSNTGMACHIIAASSGPGARRAVPGATASEITDISNGVWMCYTHGKLIDTDEHSYAIEMLKKMAFDR